jgi:hypothetical protein
MVGVLGFRPRSGLLKIVQRFIAGNWITYVFFETAKRTKETAGFKIQMSVARSAGFDQIVNTDPALKCRAIIGRPLCGLN